MNLNTINSPIFLLFSPSSWPAYADGYFISSLYSSLIKILLAFCFLFVTLSGERLSNINRFCDNPANIIIQDKGEAKKLFKYYFESKGFKSGKIKIPELNVEVMLEENQFYKKEEDVVDVYERINDIRKQFGLPTPYHDYARGYGWCGVLEAKCSKEKAYGYIVLINKNLNDASMTYTRAHENGHFLWYIGKQKIIYQKFKKPDFIKSNIHTEEDFGNLCGWVALKIAAYNLDECFIINTENPEAENSLIRLRNLVRNYLLD
jgi:hypothetical protein